MQEVGHPDDALDSHREAAVSLLYPFNHECQWRGPFYIWASNNVEDAPPKDCKPVYTCGICGAQAAAPIGD